MVKKMVIHEICMKLIKEVWILVCLQMFIQFLKKNLFRDLKHLISEAIEDARRGCSGKLFFIIPLDFSLDCLGISL